MDLYTAIGLGGVGFYVCSYGLVQVGKMDGNGAAYSAMNVVAASMVFVSLLQDFNLASMVTQITWIAVGVVGLLVRARRHFNHADVVSTSAEPDVVAHVGPQGQPAPRRQFNLRPDGVPGQLSPGSLGLRPDVAPVG